MHIATLPFFRQVHLGPHGERLRKMLLAEDAGAPTMFPCTIAAPQLHREVFKQIIVPPFRMRPKGHTAYRVGFAGMFWTFWVSSHLTDEVIGKAVLRYDGILPIRLMANAHIDRFMRGAAERMLPEAEA
jgi:hypothetical protein